MPYRAPHKALDAADLFEHRQRADAKVAVALNNIHDKQAAWVNKKGSSPDSFQGSDLVWYRRPEGSGDKLEPKWVGPAIVRERTGDQSYRVEVKEGYVMPAPRRFLKEYLIETLSGTSLPLFYHKMTSPEMNEGAPDSWDTE